VRVGIAEACAKEFKAQRRLQEVLASKLYVDEGRRELHSPDGDGDEYAECTNESPL